MAILHVRDVSEPVVEALRQRAKRNGRSLSGEVRHLLEGAVRPVREPAEVAASIAELRTRYQTTPIDVDALIREGRESR